MTRTSQLLADVRRCTRCELPLGPRPVLQLDPAARVLIAGQAPGRRVHDTGIPFNDPSGVRLRAWLGVDSETLYNPKQIALLPMAFCYPGSGRGGDLPPPPLCATTWRERLLAQLGKLELAVVIGRYAIDWHLPSERGKSLTDTVARWREFAPDVLPLPHPSPRNNLWLRRNPQVERDIVPYLQERVRELLEPRSN